MKIFGRKAKHSARRTGVLLSVSSALLAGAALTGPGALAISNGDDTAPGKAPWMATLAFTNPSPLAERSFCGGTLIAPDRVLTAGHCVRGQTPADFEVYLGADQLSKPQGKAHEARGWFSHSEWREISTPDGMFAANDLAVVMLDEPVHDVRPVQLADPDEVATAVEQQATGTVYGHGMTERTDPAKGGSADRLQQARMKLLPPEQCAPIIPDDSVGSSGFCTTGVPPAPQAPTPNVCQGDSGGPLILSTSDGPRLAGVLSAESASGCGANVKQGAFANAAEWRQEALRSDPELAPTGTLRLTGTPAVGEQLRVSVTELKPKNAKISYTWYEQKKDGTGFIYYVPIEGADDSTFTVPERLAGTPLRVGAELSTSAGEVRLAKPIEPVKP